MLPPERIELSTPGLQDQCSATELKRLVVERCKLGSQWQVQILTGVAGKKYVLRHFCYLLVPTYIAESAAVKCVALFYTRHQAVDC